jgi:hypothetical protein
MFCRDLQFEIIEILFLICGENTAVNYRGFDYNIGPRPPVAYVLYVCG